MKLRREQIKNERPRDNQRDNTCVCWDSLNNYIIIRFQSINYNQKELSDVSDVLLLGYSATVQSFIFFWPPSLSRFSFNACMIENKAVCILASSDQSTSPVSLNLTGCQMDALCLLNERYICATQEEMPQGPSSYVTGKSQKKEIRSRWFHWSEWVVHS